MEFVLFCDNDNCVSFFDIKIGFWGEFYVGEYVFCFDCFGRIEGFNYSFCFLEGWYDLKVWCFVYIVCVWFEC